ncbi:MAG: hypothetical protein IPG96_12720 [Proteobacteria bacterium]|nr:hypothetical protein [Pseudomonadota bacterium]
MLYTHPLPGQRQQLSDRLPPAGRYRAVALARDDAGNLSDPVTVIFDSSGLPGSVASSPPSPLAGGGGCALVPAPGSGMLLALLALWLVAIVRRAAGRSPMRAIRRRRGLPRR